MDDKHVAIKCPRNGGSIYYNYKGYHAIVLMAVVDADYMFIWVEAGSNGSVSDAQIFNSCVFILPWRREHWDYHHPIVSLVMTSWCHTFSLEMIPSP